MIKIDMHVHTEYSKDSFMRPEKLIKTARHRGLGAVAVTDHNSFKGAVTAERINMHNDFFIIKAEEVKTEYGDIIGLFIEKEINSRKFLDVIKEIKEQNGFTVLPHPYSKNTSLPEELIENNIDIIEVFNARQKKLKNIQAKALAEKYKKPVIAGSDAHNYFEIGRAYIEIKENIINIDDIKKAVKRNIIEIKGRLTPYYLSHGLSMINEKIKYAFGN